MYKVLLNFADLQDDKYIYLAGDTYPREGYTPDKERIDELCGSDNAFGKPIIAEAKTKKSKGV